MIRGVIGLLVAGLVLLQPVLLPTVLDKGGIGSDAVAGERRRASPSWTSVPFHSWLTLRTRDVVLQQLDFSCGAASVATIATYYLGHPVTEEQALLTVRRRYTAEEWKGKVNSGLSFDDLAYMASQFGLAAQGGKVGLSGLLQLNGPVIVHLDKGKGNFLHFSVLRGIEGLTVYMADPLLGTAPMSLGDFLDQFTGAVLAVWDPKKPLPSDYILKLEEQDAFYDNAYSAVRGSLYDRLRPIGPSF